MRKKEVGRMAAWLLSAALLCGQIPSTALAAGNMPTGDGNAVVATVSGDDVETETDGSSDIVADVSTNDPAAVIGNDDNGIPDPTLYNKLLESGDANGDGKLTIGEAQNIQYLYMEFSGSLKNLSCYVPALKTLNLSNFKTDVTLSAEDISEVAGLSELTSLQINNITLDSAEELGKLHKLTYLSLDNNKLEDVSFITNENYPSLQNLSLCNPIYKMPDQFAGLSELTFLNMSFCELRELADLTSLTQLTNLNLSGNYLTREEIVAHISELFVNNDEWMNSAVNASYDPTTDEYFPENRAEILNSEEGIPDQKLYEAMLSYGDEVNGNKDGKLSVAEARKITYLHVIDSGNMKNLSIYAPNIQDLSLGIDYEVQEHPVVSAESVLEIGNLAKLSFLSIHNLEIQDATGLGNLHTLTNLTLSNNKIKDISFITKENFPLLSNLSLSNPIYKMPDSITDLPSLTSLNMNGCELRELADMTQMERLENLWLSGNYLLEDELLEKAPKKFAEDANWIEQTVNKYYDPSTDEYYEQNRTPVTNDTDGIPDKELYALLLQRGDEFNGNADGILTVAEARKITYLYLNTDILDYTNLAKYVPNLTNIGSNYFNAAQWAAVEQSFLEEFEKLAKITSVNMYIYSDKALEAICGKTEIRNLTLSGISGISSLLPLADLKQLYSLNLSSVLDSAELISVINQYSELRELNLSGFNPDQIMNLSDTIKAQLTNLYLYNWISGSQSYDIDFSGFNSLTQLNVTGNITSISGLEQLTSLRSLSLSKSINQELRATLCGLPENLTSINLSAFAVNNLKDSGITELKQVNYLTLNNCDLKDVSGIEELTKIYHLDLRSNMITDAAPIGSLTGLNWLDLTNNQLTSISGLSGLTNLERLYLQNNRLTDLSGAEQLLNLRQLDVSNNQLQEIPDLSGLERLTDKFDWSSIWENLVLSGNQFSKEAIVGKVPQLFSNSNVWLARALAAYINDNLCYSSMDSDTFYDVITENHNSAVDFYSTIYFQKDSVVELDAEILDIIKEDNIKLNIYFSETGRGYVTTYNMGGMYPFPSAVEGITLRSQEVMEDIPEEQAVKAYFNEYEDIELHYYENDSALVNNHIAFSFNPEFIQTGNYVVYYFNRKQNSMSRLDGVSLSLYSGFSNYQYQYDSASGGGEYILNDLMNQPAEEGFYVFVDSKYTITNNNPGEYSDPTYYKGTYYDNNNIADILAEKVDAAAQGDTISIAYYGYISMKAELWNQAVDKELNWEITEVNYQRAIQSVVKIKAEDTYKISNNSFMGLSNSVGELYTTDTTLMEYLKDYKAAFVRIGVLYRKAEITLYVGRLYKNGENLNLYSYYYPTFMSGGDNRVIVEEMDTETMTVSYGMVTYTAGKPNGNMFLVNGKLDLPEEPDVSGGDNPDVDEPDVSGGDNPDVDEPDIDNPDVDEPDIDNPDVDTPDIDNPDDGTEEDPGDNPDDGDNPMPDSKPVVIEEEKIIKTEETNHTLIDKMDGKRKDVEVVVKKNPDEPLTLSKNVFDKMLSENKNVSVSVVNDKNELQYGWSFPINDSRVDPAKFADLDLSITFNTEKENEIKALTKQQDALYISFAHHGDLPMPATIKNYVGDKYKDGEKVYLYYYNEENNRVEAIKDAYGRMGLIVENGYVTYTITHCSVYFLAEAAPEELGVIIEDQSEKQQGNDNNNQDNGGNNDSDTSVPEPVNTSQNTQIKSPLTGDKTREIDLLLLLAVFSAGAAIVCLKKAKKQ